MENTATIYNQVTRHFEELDVLIDERKAANPEYVKTERAYEEVVERLVGMDKEMAMEAEELVNYMIALADEAAYSQGYADAVKMMAACFQK